MVDQLGYPKSLLSIEKSLVDIADETFLSSDIPNRRVDIVSFSKKSAKPLLLIECKAEYLTEKSFRQVIGYNYYVKAPYIAVASEHAILMGLFDEKKSSYEFREGLAPYQELTKVL